MRWMRPIDNAYTYQGSQRAKEKCQQLMGELPSPLLRRRRRFAEWSIWNVAFLAKPNRFADDVRCWLRDVGPPKRLIVNLML